ncbi:hypothetical protein PPYR_09515 [Photinus pyralis]|uniref:Decaprenyl-diphosphate synthase subunit 2 n=1 Tax=Photinus pyralis TaxID=7054 RepID=A0A1Y1KQA8_PHOPY|nr:decaprenyl-diphosphate synthase subunit 2-like [Photinus pyralis]XP_031343279.1 decaprenyl-diphosphate synthase subunit 2-like [Photinus pyralis]XP_031343434.1 decaprenyl-diphosphate synthase subunit 2-like [Photinus pyralis]KAB0798522.1 hypothetical protein PPYR_09515 [Photinus pyralis]
MALKHTQSLFRAKFLRNIHHHSPAIVEAKANLTQAVTEAEKVVGYPTSFLNLRWLLTDELANVAKHIRKLIKVNHPLIEEARKIFMGNNNDMPSWGLIVLLVSNSCGIKESFSEYDRDTSSGVLYSQRALAEVTEMIRISNILHKNVVNVDKKMLDELADLNFGNKLAMLSGDYLLSKSFRELALLKNSDLNELMSSSLRDLAEADFIGIETEFAAQLPCKPVNAPTALKIVDHFGTEPHKVHEILGNPIAEWTLRTTLGGATLLAKSCRGALILARHSEPLQKLGFLVGKNIALACQAKIDQEPFLPGQSGTFSLISAPVMVHLNHFPNFYEKLMTSNIDYDSIRQEIQSGPGLEGAQDLQQHFSKEALRVLNELPNSDARIALENIVKTLHSSDL